MKTYDYIGKPCTVCQKVKPLTSFHRNKDMKDGRLSRCKECVAPRRWDSGRRRETNSERVAFGKDCKYGNTWLSLHVAFQTIERVGA